MLGMPSQTDFDLKFTFLGIPVRVTPWFWLFSALLGRSDDPQTILIWVACVFLSILIHEYGHGLMAKAFGFHSSIVLHGLFGMCESQAERQTAWQRLAVLICGPAAGLLTFGLVLGSVILIGSDRLSPLGSKVANDMILINLVWSIFNLIPIYPMDGGQIMKVLLVMFNRSKGGRWAHIASLIGAGVLGSYMLVNQQFLMVLFCAYFALVNYQALQMDYQFAKYGGQNDDWWRQ
jgi:stage IV sporulation protein FB